MLKKVLFTRQAASSPQSGQILPDLHLKSFYITVSSKTTVPGCDHIFSPLSGSTWLLTIGLESDVLPSPSTVAHKKLFPLLASYRRQQPPLPFGQGIALKSSRISNCFSLLCRKQATTTSPSTDQLQNQADQ